MSGEPWLGNGPDSVPEAAWRAPMADNWRPLRGQRATVILPQPDEPTAMLSASATILSTTHGPLSSTALLRQGLRQISAAGLAPAPVPRHVVNSGPGRIALRSYIPSVCSFCFASYTGVDSLSVGVPPPP